MKGIEYIHKTNKQFIKDNNLIVGSKIITRGKDGRDHLLVVTHIHTLYGWIEAENDIGHKAYNIPIENIKEVV